MSDGDLALINPFEKIARLKYELSKVAAERDALRDELDRSLKDAHIAETCAARAEDELNALREQLADAKKALDEAADLLDEMAEALEKIADPINWGPDGAWDAHSYPDEIARAVLKKLRGE